MKNIHLININFSKFVSERGERERDKRRSILALKDYHLWMERIKGLFIFLLYTQTFV
jgi:hypothetical protein